MDHRLDDTVTIAIPTTIPNFYSGSRTPFVPNHNIYTKAERAENKSARMRTRGREKYREEKCMKSEGGVLRT